MSIALDPTCSQHAQGIEHIAQVLRHKDQTDVCRAAVRPPEWIEARLLGEECDSATTYADADHLVEFL